MNETYFIPGNGTGKALDYELRFQLLSKLALRNVADVSSTELASFLNAFIVSCINPRDFHGVDLVEELRSRVDSQDYTNPFVLLSLCNAGENMTTRDVHKLLNAFNLAHRELWTDIQAYAVMALSCAANQPDSNYDLQNITGLTRTLKALQNVNGTIDNLKTTGLVLQALIAAGDLKDRHNFNVEKAFLQLTDSQKVDGSFEDVLKAYYVLPVFGYKSLINISSSHCRVHDKGENDILREWRNQLGEKIQIRYSLWLGNDKYLERTLKLTVPASTRFYRIMEVAAQLDDRYRFKSTLRDGKPYIYSISRIEDDPEGEKFWFLYREAETLDNSTAVLIEKSPIDYIPEDGEHLAFWFRHGPWTT